MTRTFLLRIVLAFFLGIACLPASGLVPQPSSLTVDGGEMALTSSSRIFYETRSTIRPIEDTLRPFAEVLAEELEITTGIKPALVLKNGSSLPGPGDISLEFESPGAFATSEELENQSYTLTVSDRVIIRSQYTKGVSYGTSTLIQSVIEDGSTFSIPKMTIADSPAAAYRSVMIDVARDPSAISSVKEVVRLARYYKLRYLHFHLTDSQHFTFPFTPVIDGLAGKGNFSYSRSELEDLVTYANARGITIIPELEIPGHSERLKQSGYLNRDASDREVAHPDNFPKIHAIIDDMLDVFWTSPYFHMGGEESGAGDALLPLIESVNNHLRGKPDNEKKRLIVWESFHGFPAAQIPPTGDNRVIVMSWESSENPPWQLLSNGYEIINCSWKPMYVVGSGTTHRGAHVRQLMWSPEVIHSWDKNIFMHWDPARPVYHDVGPNDPVIGDGKWNATWINRQSQILGGQMLSWEQNEKTIVRDLLPRLPVVADRLWNPRDSEDYTAFDARLSGVREKGLSIVQPVEILPYSETPDAPYSADYRYYSGSNVQITLRNRTKIPGTIRYTTGTSNQQLDGMNFSKVAETTSASPAYTAPFTSPSGGFGIRAQLYRSNGTPVDGHDWQHYNNPPNNVEMTEFVVPRVKFSSVPDFASYTSDKIIHKTRLPLIRGPYVLDEVKGQMFRGTLQAPGSGTFELKLQVNDGLASAYIDLNRNGIWEESDRVFSNIGGDVEVLKNVTLDSQPYRVRLDHAGGFIAPTLIFQIQGPGTSGRKFVSQYLTPPDEDTLPPATPQRVTPTDGMSGVLTPLPLRWSSERADSYDLFVWSAKSLKPTTPTAADLTTNTYELSSLEPGSTYRWSVVAKNTNGSTESSMGSFTTFATRQIKSVGWNFDNAYTGPQYDTLGAEEVAGAPAFVQSNWNNHLGGGPGGQGPGTVPFSLHDNEGNPTSIRVKSWTLFTNDSWQHGYTGTESNAKLMNSFTDKRPALTFDGIPAEYRDAGYSVVVYYGNTDGPSTSTLSLQGSVDDQRSLTIQTGNTAQSAYHHVGYIEGTSTSTGPTNYTVFNGLNDPEFTVSLTDGSVNGNNNGIAAIQIFYLPPAPPLEDSIGWNYDGPYGDDFLASTDLAGAPGFRQRHWNNHAGIGQGPGSLPFVLKDASGNATTASVTGWVHQYGSDSNSHSFSAPLTADEKLLNSYANRGARITFSGIPASYLANGYTVVVYYTSRSPVPGASTLSILGPDDATLASTLTYTGATQSFSAGQSSIREIGYTAGDGNGATVSNYSSFSGLTSPSFTVFLDSQNHNGISAVQIVKESSTGFARWQELTPGAGEETESDHDADGWVDLVEYALGGDPLHGTPPAGLPQIHDEGGHPTLTYRRPLDVLDVTYELEGSIDCVNWYTITDLDPEISESGDWQSVTYSNLSSTSDVPGIESSPRSFFRISVSIR
jgi:hypothetical protein